MKNIIVLAAGKATRMGSMRPDSKLFLAKNYQPIISNILEAFGKQNHFVFCIRPDQNYLVSSFLNLVYPELSHTLVECKTDSVLATLREGLKAIQGSSDTSVTVTVADSFYTAPLFFLKDTLSLESWIAVAKMSNTSQDYIVTRASYPTKWLNKPRNITTDFLAFTGTFSAPINRIAVLLEYSSTLYNMITHIKFKALIDVSNVWEDFGTKEKYEQITKLDYFKKHGTQTFITNNQVVKYFGGSVRAQTYAERQGGSKILGFCVSAPYVKGVTADSVTSFEVSKIFEHRLSVSSARFEETFLKDKVIDVLEELLPWTGFNTEALLSTFPQSQGNRELVENVKETVRTLDLGRSIMLHKVHGDPTLQNIIVNGKDITLIDPSSSNFPDNATSLLYEISKLYASAKFNFKSIGSGAFYTTIQNSFITGICVREDNYDTTGIVDYAESKGLTLRQLELGAALHLIGMSQNYLNKDVRSILFHTGLSNLLSLTKKQGTEFTIKSKK
jgi:hypothetical protein